MPNLTFHSHPSKREINSLGWEENQAVLVRGSCAETDRLDSRCEGSGSGALQADNSMGMEWLFWRSLNAYRSVLCGPIRYSVYSPSHSIVDRLTLRFSPARIHRPGLGSWSNTCRHVLPVAASSSSRHGLFFYTVCLRLTTYRFGLFFPSVY